MHEIGQQRAATTTATEQLDLLQAVALQIEPLQVDERAERVPLELGHTSQAV
jgi:hypothetical protein